MDTNYDLIVLGSGPGGYMAAVRASQLHLKVAVVERESLGGICLNWGCIPTKALLKSASVYNDLKHGDNFGISCASDLKPDFAKIIERSRGVAAAMSKGVEFLMKKNKITVCMGTGRLVSPSSVQVTASDGTATTLTAKHIILATGARSSSLKGLPHDGVHVIGYREALTLPAQPKSMIVVGSGAIGTELAFFYRSLGTEVTLIEFMPVIVPLEDDDVSLQLARSFKKMGIKIMTSTAVDKVEVVDNECVVSYTDKKGNAGSVVGEVVLSAAGVKANIEGIGLEELGIATEHGKVIVDEKYSTNVAGIYAIGDIIATQALAHVASAEAICCVEHIAGLNPEPIDYYNIPACVYCTPEVASVGITERYAIANDVKYKVAKYMFQASGKAAAAGNKDGFVKLIVDANTDRILGAHIIGEHISEIISELTLARKMNVTATTLMQTIHPHPSMSEAVMEAAATIHR